MHSEGIQLHVAEGRPKDVEGFREKLQRPGKSYHNGLEEITDLAGCRLICYYLDDVSKIVNIIKSEFEIVEEELSHQPSAFAVDRFGYISVHYVVRLLANRSSLSEWKLFSNYKAEIQIRTVIQHAWSAVSHAIQYKSVAQVPSQLQRRLYRIAGLFELADEEFRGIRSDSLAQRAEAARAIAQGEDNILLSAASIGEFLDRWNGRNKLEASARAAGFELGNNYEDYVGNIYDLSTMVGLKTISDLEKVLDNEDTSRLGAIYGGQRDKVAWSASVNFLIYIMLISAFRDKVSSQYLVEKGGWNVNIAEDVINSINT